MSEPLLLSIEDAASKLGVHPNTIRNLIDRGALPSIVVTRRTDGQASRRMIATSDLEAFIERGRQVQRRGYYTEGRSTDGE